MSRKELYQVRTTDIPNQWAVLKCDFDMNPTGRYIVSQGVNSTNRFCDCFAGNKEVCRHRTMIPMFEELGRINTNWWYNFDKNTWIQFTPAGSDLL